THPETGGGEPGWAHPPPGGGVRLDTPTGGRSSWRNSGQHRPLSSTRSIAMETADTPLQLIEANFDHHARGLTAVIDGTEVTRLPDRRIGLRELENVLTVEGSDADTKDEIWAHLVARART